MSKLIKEFLEISLFIFLKILGFFSEFFIIFPEKGDRFPVDSATQHFHTIFFRLYMNY